MVNQILLIILTKCHTRYKFGIVISIQCQQDATVRHFGDVICHIFTREILRKRAHQFILIKRIFPIQMSHFFCRSSCYWLSNLFCSYLSIDVYLYSCTLKSKWAFQVNPISRGLLSHIPYLYWWWLNFNH